MQNGSVGVKFLSCLWNWRGKAVTRYSRETDTVVLST